jgi:hypothetical protein
MTKPSDSREQPSWFDQMATKVGDLVARAWFFWACVLMVLIWAPSYFAVKTLDTWQLIINTLTTIITFLLVALLQNTTKRDSDASQHKLNAIAAGLGDGLEALRVLMEELDISGKATRKLDSDILELSQAVGLELHQRT